MAIRNTLIKLDEFAGEKVVKLGSCVSRSIEWIFLKTWKPSAKLSIGVACSLIGSHYYCPTYLEFERQVVRDWTPLQASAQNAISARSYATQEAIRAGISPVWVIAVMHVESNENHLVTSRAGARGIMQVMPTNAARCGISVKDLDDMHKNIKCGIQILSENLRARKGNMLEATLMYNGGMKALTNPVPESTRYVVLVTNQIAKDTLS